MTRTFLTFRGDLSVVVVARMGRFTVVRSVERPRTTQLGQPPSDLRHVNEPSQQTADLTISPVYLVRVLVDVLAATSHTPRRHCSHTRTAFSNNDASYLQNCRLRLRRCIIRQIYWNRKHPIQCVLTGAGNSYLEHHHLHVQVMTLT